MATALLVF